MSEDKDKIIEDYIKQCNPYESHPSIGFDLRAYAAYVKENNLKASDITEEILSKFSTEPKQS